MTLQQWLDEAKTKPIRVEHRGNLSATTVSVIADHTSPMRPKLWDLEDYAVSSALGIVIWLIPK